MVLFEDLGRLLDVVDVFGTLVPGQLDDGREVGPDHRRFGRVRVHARESVQLALRFLHHFVGEVELLELLAEALDFVLFVVGARQLLLQRLDLLAQEVLALVLVDLFLDLALEAPLRLLQLDLGVDQHEHEAQSLGDGVGLQHGLLVLELEVEVVGHVVGELAGVLEVHDELRDVDLKVAVRVLDEVRELLLELAVGGPEQRFVAVGHVDGGDVGLDEVAGVVVRVDPHASEGADEHLDRAVRVLLHPHDVAGGAHLEQIVGRGLLDLAVALAHDDDGAIAVEGRVDRVDRHGPPGVDRHDHRRVQDRAAHRADRDGVVEFVGGRLLAHRELLSTRFGVAGSASGGASRRPSDRHA